MDAATFRDFLLSELESPAGGTQVLTKVAHHSDRRAWGGTSGLAPGEYSAERLEIIG